MQLSKEIWRIILVNLILAVLTANIFAQEIKVLNQSPLISFDNDKSIEPSAVEPIGDGKFLLVADDKDDKGKSLKIVEAKMGKVLKLLDRIQSADKNAKWEAMAKDEDGNYYVIGSHFEESDAEKLAFRSQMFRFRLENEAEQDATKIKITDVKPLNIKDSLALTKLYSQVPADNKAKIEGLAVRTINCQKELIIGFREPSDVVQIYSAMMPNDELKNTSNFNLSLKPLFQFNAGKTVDNTPYKLSSIEYIPALKGFFILTSTETTAADGKPVFHGNALWFVSDKAIENAQPKLLSDTYKSANVQKILEFEPKMKVEGMCLFNMKDNKTLQLAVVYDNDTKDSGQIGKLQFIDLTVTN